MGGSRRPPSKDVHADLINVQAAIPGIFRERNLARAKSVASENELKMFPQQQDDRAIPKKEK
jgi:hypothetical protein